MGVVRRRGDRQHPADRLDPVGVAMIVDERDHGFDRRSSSAWAKYADALRRISLAWRSSRISRSSALIRSRSSLVRPGRWPRSRSACRTQLAQRLAGAADLRRNRADRRPLRGVIAAGAPAPSAPRAPAPQAKIGSMSSSSWLHPLKSWSLRQTRRGSGRHP